MKEIKEIILMSPLPPPVGGIGTWTERFINYIQNEGIHADVVKENIIGKREVFGENSKRNLINELKRSFYIWKQLKRKTKNNGAQIVHCNIPGTPFAILREYISAKICKRRHTPFVLHLHSTISMSLNSFIGRFLLKKISKKCSGIFVLNNQSFDFMSKLNKKCRVFQIPNFVDREEIYFRENVNDVLSNILYVGGVVEEKGVNTIIDVACETPNIMYRMAGLSSKSVRKYLESKNINNVELLGVLNKQQLEVEYKKADLFMFLTKFKSEGFSVALTEAMAKGLPCISTDWAANKDMLGNYSSYQIVDIDNSKQVLEKIQILSDKKLRYEISQYNSKRVESDFCIDVIAKQIIKIYEKLI